MIAAFLGGISAGPFGRAALRYGGIAPAVLLFLLSIRSAGERVGRLAERLEATEKTNEVQRRMLEVAARRPRNRNELVDRFRWTSCKTPRCSSKLSEFQPEKAKIFNLATSILVCRSSSVRRNPSLM